MPLFTQRYTNEFYAVLRIVTGFLFFWHGMDKIFGYPTLNLPEKSVFITYTAGLIELVGGVLIVIGMFTRITAFISSGMMAFAYWIHFAPKSLLPYLSLGDVAVLYCFLFLYMSAYGAGIWSVDAWLEKRRAGKK